MPRYSISHLMQLEAESIHVMREVAAEFERPVMLYSVGKDSSVMLHLARKAFYPQKLPFPLMHVDTGYKFEEMYDFRRRMAEEYEADLIVYRNEEAIAEGANPYDLGTQRCCGLLKTQALLDGLREGRFDAALGGARREEEKSRAKERFFHSGTGSASGIRRTSGPNCGTCTTAASARRNPSGSSPSPTGPNWTSGCTSTGRKSRSYPCISPGSARSWSGESN